ncbi:MAG: hypothetical protein LBC20_02590 [Planctomycetaceae bacterium]|jgi:type VI secretion system protein ImpL|nr:hypothetical protein [Planctomycetaceae bacterium]
MLGNIVLFSMMLHDWIFWTLIGIVLLLIILLIVIFVWFRRHGIAHDAQQKTGKTKRNYSGIHSDLQRLQRHLGTNKSTCPIFLVLGDTLPSSIQTVFTEYDGEYLEATQLDFHLFERGVLIVPKTDLVTQGTLERGVYDNLFRELLRIRPQRPLDGVVLSISTDTVRKIDEAGRVAAHLHEQLIRLQKITGMRLPVHLLFHDCEKLTGFHELGHVWNKSQICDTLGWNPEYTKYREWRNDWLHEAQESISAQLQRIRIDVFSDISVKSEQESQHLFLLTDELNQLQSGLIQFCNYIFSKSVYHEPFIFHGLAFGGTITGGTSSDGTPTQRFAFAHRLLRESLPEGAVLAIPVRQIFQARTRTVRVVQIFCSALLIFWWYGMLWQLPALKQDVASVIRFGKNWDRFYVQNQELLESRSLENVTDKNIIAPSQRDLLREIIFDTKKENYDGLSSIFFPVSCFSSLNNEVFLWYVKFYRDFVNNSIPQAMTWRAAEIYEMNTNDRQFDDIDEKFVTPFETREYQKLEQHVHLSCEFYRMFGTYETFLKNGNLADFLELTSYLWKMDENFVADCTRNEHLNLELLLEQVLQRRTIMLRQHPEQNEFLKTKNEITQLERNKFNRLSCQFDERIYKRNALLLYLEQIELLLNDTESLMTTPLEREKLEQYWTVLNCVILALKDERYNWILYDKPLYNDDNFSIRNKIRKETFLNDSDVKRWDDNAVLLKREQFERMKNLQSNRSGKFFEQQSSHTLTPLPWLESLTTLVGRLRQESFMQQIEKAYVLPLAGNPMSVEWDGQILFNALQLADRYGKIFNETEIKYDNLIQIKARQQLIDNMHKLLADSRRIHRLPVTEYGVYGNFQDAAASILQFLSLYQSFGDDAKRQRNELMIAADQQALALLASFDKQCLADHLYEPNQTTFAAWNGSGSILVPLLGMAMEGEIDSYLTLRRQRLKYWKNRIDPILTYLLNRNDLSPSDDDVTRIERWKVIREGVEQHEAQTPNNPIMQLEQFIKTELPKQEHEPISPSPNWFYQRMYELDRTAREWKQSQAKLDFFAQWNKAATFFNTYLKGRFPFVTDHFAQSPSASPDAVRTFYSLLPEMPTQPTAWVIPLDYINFYETINKIKPIFFGKLHGPNTIPDIIVSIKYHIANPSENGHSWILDQSLQLDNQEFSVRNGITEGVWKFGSPMRFTLQWAKDGGVIPVAPTEHRQATLQDMRIVYDYPSSWSLFVFIAENIQPVLEKDQAGNINRITDLLIFEVPTKSNETNHSNHSDKSVANLFRTFVQIRLAKIGNDGNKEDIIIPCYFPDWMPTEGDMKRFEIPEKRTEIPVLNSPNSHQKTETSSVLTPPVTKITEQECPPFQFLFPQLLQKFPKRKVRNFQELSIPPLNKGEIFQGWINDSVDFPVQSPTSTPILVLPNDQQ